MEKPSTVFVRNGDESGTDPWDDTLLVEAYNKSVEGVKKTIAEKITMTNGDCNGVTDLSSSEKVWKAGEFCRSTYSEDGIEYEAKILRIFLDGTCIVKYCGYDNEEIVTTKSLKKTAGKQARIKQRIAATESENLTDVSDNYNYANLHMTKISDTSKINRSSPIPGMNCIPPPPPPNVIAQIGGVEGESDALSSMLMSWYMSGYHTGYYNALMQTKKQCKKTNAFIKGKKPQKK